MNNIVYYVLFSVMLAISKLPSWIHYFNSSVMAFVLYHVVKYRRSIVEKNIKESFPNLSPQEQNELKKKFYSHLCDIFVESVMYLGMSESEMRHRMRFYGLDIIRNDCIKGRSIALYLGHYANWEWVSSLSLHLGDVCTTSQIYHPMESPLFDRLIGYTRSRFGGKNIPIDGSIRHILTYARQEKPIMVGFISDQTPRWNNIHLWIPFLGHAETPVFTGAERIAKRLDMAVYYLDVRKVKRGYYLAEFIPMTSRPRELPDFEITKMYSHMLEETIRRNPSLWLWSHNRWKRTKQEWEKRYGKRQTEKYETGI